MVLRFGEKVLFDGVDMRAILKLSVFMVIMTVALGAASTSAQNDQLLTPVAQTRAVQTDSKITQFKTVQFNPALFMKRSAANVTVTLFDGREITIEPENIEQRPYGSGGWVMTGRVRGYPLSEVVFTWRDQVAAATINLGQQDIYRLRHVEDGVHLFEQLPLFYLPTSEPDTPAGATRQQAQTHFHAEHPNNYQVESSNAPTIDILVIYTDLAETAMGGQVGTQNTVGLALEESNLGFTNSRVNARFNIVHTHKVDFTESTYTFSEMLGAMTSANDGLLDEIHALRDQYGADVVSLIVDRPLLCGKTYQNSGRFSNFDRYAFVVLHHSCVTGYYSFGHEIGHLMGSQHDRGNASQAGIFDYSYGYQDPNHNFRTIMAYNCVVSCPRINYWSNPNIKYNDVGATGVSIDHAHGANNSLSLSQLAPVVAAYRHPVIPSDQTVKVSFQSEALEGFEGYLIDNGGPIGVKNDQLVYGWRGEIVGLEFNAAADSPSTTYIHAVGERGAAAEWEMLLPNGTYQVRVVSGGARDGRDSASMLIEGQLLENSQLNLFLKDAASAVLDEEITVNVTDGYLTISGTQDETTLNLVEITPLFTNPDGSTQVEPGTTGPYKNTIFMPLVVR